jgi:hypothetical protein
MRKLSGKQKKLIEDVVYSKQFVGGQLSGSQLSELEALNDYETLWQDANGYAYDVSQK